MCRVPAALPRYPQLAEDEDDKDREKREIGSRTSRELASHSRELQLEATEGGGSGSYLHWKFKTWEKGKPDPREQSILVSDETFLDIPRAYLANEIPTREKRRCGKKFQLVCNEGCKDLVFYLPWGTRLNEQRLAVTVRQAGFSHAVVEDTAYVGLSDVCGYYSCGIVSLPRAPERRSHWQTISTVNI
ncbi:hypothetical protein ALC62_00972 [Cyphomyrmex costatus]|uniref:Uncharacterized protein n=1 Tax=Cyphomyrmex costatus TaxID=456900 RepID=A0A195D5H7_9HYME|nr:hypothetical protein ALC62_00972 [Cyphomyrmex costatus]